MKVRGTTNQNVRGNTRDRARRKAWLMQHWASDSIGYVRCYRCGIMLNEERLTVDRIVPGNKGGRYVRGNIRPACRHCNSATANRAK